MVINKHVFSFHIILLDLAVFHFEDHEVDVVALQAEYQSTHLASQHPQHAAA